MKKTLITTTLAAALTLTACGPSVEPDSTYETTEDLAEAINSAGDFGCEPRHSEEGLRDNGWISVQCDQSWGAIYESKATRNWVYGKNPLEQGEARLTGPNWSFTDGRRNIESAQNVLGGSVETYKAPEAAQPSSLPDPVEPGFEFRCSAGLGHDSQEFDSFEDAWELDPDDRLSCIGSWKHSPESEAAAQHDYTDTELEAIETAGYDDKSSLKYLHSKCAEGYLGKDDEHNIELGEDGLAEYEGAVALCPDHPERDEAERRVTESAEVHEQRENGERIAGGPHRVGEDMQPGTYVSEDDEGFENCYWERLDSAGNIIDNNFITSGFRAEVTVAASDYSFSAEGCGEWAKQ